MAAQLVGPSFLLAQPQILLHFFQALHIPILCVLPELPPAQTGNRLTPVDSGQAWPQWKWDGEKAKLSLLMPSGEQGLSCLHRWPKPGLCITNFPLTAMVSSKLGCTAVAYSLTSNAAWNKSAVWIGHRVAVLGTSSEELLLGQWLFSIDLQNTHLLQSCPAIQTQTIFF